MRYCPRCGREFLPNARFCCSCGCPIPAPSGQPAATYPAAPAGGFVYGQKTLVQQLSERYKINGIIWIVVAGLQLLIGLFLNWIVLIIGVLNLISALQDLSFSKTVLTNPVGIVDKNESLVGPIITLVYNLIFGGILGVAGSIYYFVGIRSFVMQNEAAFRMLESQHKKSV